MCACVLLCVYVSVHTCLRVVHVCICACVGHVYICVLACVCVYCSLTRACEDFALDFMLCMVCFLQDWD